MASDYLVDVNIACYNQEKFIAKALDSVLKQKTTFRYRIVIGDDCSSDRSAEIIKKYELEFPGVITAFYHTQNRGINRGVESNGVFLLRQSTAKYIALLDGDDFWLDEYKLQKQTEFLEKNDDYSFSFHPVEILNETGKEKAPELLLPPIADPSLTDILGGHFIPTGSLVFRRDLFDWEFFLQEVGKIRSVDIFMELLLRLKGRGYLINEKMACYRAWNSSFTAKGRDDYKWVTKTFALYKIFNRYSGFILADEIYKKVTGLLREENQYIRYSTKGMEKIKRRIKNYSSAFSNLPFKIFFSYLKNDLSVSLSRRLK